MEEKRLIKLSLAKEAESRLKEASECIVIEIEHSFESRKPTPITIFQETPSRKNDAETPDSLRYDLVYLSRSEPVSPIHIVQRQNFLNSQFQGSNTYFNLNTSGSFFGRSR
jgi:hypothetical protein